MKARSSRQGTVDRRRGALLLEVMLALALFVIGGLAVLAIVDRAIGAERRMRDAEHGAMLARSAMARIEAGLAGPQSLNGPVREADGEGAEGSAGPTADRGWELEISTEPSSVRGLTLVRVTALRRPVGNDAAVVASYTLSQFVRLSRTVSMRAGGEP